MKKLILLTILLGFASAASAAKTQDLTPDMAQEKTQDMAQEKAPDMTQDLQGDRFFMVTEYRYDPGDTGGDPDTGHALCGTRCNALSVDYRNFIEPGGWRFIKVARNLEVTLPIGNPFLGGKCICTADEYVVKVNDFNQYRPPAAK